MARLASVILDIPTQALDSPYTYAVPSDLDDVAVGCAVYVPFGHRPAIGFVIDLFDGDAADLGIKNVKPIQRVLSAPYFNEGGAACARFLAHRYVAPLSSCIRLFTPPGGVARLRSADGAWHVDQPSVGQVDDRWVMRGEGFDEYIPRRTAVKQRAIMSALSKGEVRVAELTAEYGSVSSALKSLVAKDVIRIEHRRRYRGDAATIAADDSVEGNPGDAKSAFIPSPKPELTDGQAHALAAIDNAIARSDGRVVLIDGVTGSGKTEVYLRAIEHVLAEGKSACVLVPEISLTPQTVARFRGRFGSIVAVMHSRMSQGERYDQWDFIRSGEARVVVGARSALFTPMSNLGLIVIDEEHEGSYKQDSAPRYVARDVAEWMVKRQGGTLVLGSATPSIASLYKASKCDTWSQVSLPKRVNGRDLPEIQVVDMAKEFSSGHRLMFSRSLINALETELNAGHKAVLLLNQRGFARFLLCRDCGYVPTCPSCSTSLTFHERGNLLMCHHCGYKELAPARCPKCDSPYLRRFGAGTQRVEDELRALLESFTGEAKEAPIIRMDADTTSKKGAHQSLLESFASAQAAVLLGTQMIAKGLDFDDVTVVGVINADTMLKLPDFRAGERTFDLIEQVAGRAGRAELPGTVIVQTYCATDSAIRAAAAYDRDAFLAEELHKRKLLYYPPFSRLTNVLVWGKDERAVRTQAQNIEVGLRGCFEKSDLDSWEVLPATPCVLARLRTMYRWHVVIKCAPEADVSSVIEPFFRARANDSLTNVAADVDAYDLL
ncbi:MAG: primosomal protein N' [Eggerthellaceae bacterium]|nr:primosomal protein N' [Eggerthellaceae bacterium]